MGLLGSARRRHAASRQTRAPRVLTYGAAVVIVIMVATTIAILWPGGSRTHVTAYFERATGVYPGTEVRILGVKVGKVTKVTPEGNVVEVKMAYDAKYKVPAGAQAVIIVPSLVAGAVLCWARAIGEFGATVIFGGNTPGTTQTMPTLVLSVFQITGDPEAAVGLSLPLMLIAVVVLVSLRDRWLRAAPAS